MTARRRRLLLAAAACVALLASACGVRFGDAEEGTEFFRRIQVTGTHRAGEPMTVLVDYETFYPVPLSVRCELWHDDELLQVLEDDHQVRELPAGNTASTPVPGALARDFVVREAGEYRVECLTPYDQDNFIAEVFDVAPAPEPTATPEPRPTPLGAENSPPAGGQ